MSDEGDDVAEAERSLRQALQVMAHPGSGYQPEEWCLIATLIAEAGLVAQAEQLKAPTFQMPQLEEAVEELKELTAGFTDPSFLRATKAARRRNPALFTNRG